VSGDDPAPSDDHPDTDDWPLPLRGVTESVVTTLGPNDLWNVAALGLHAPEGSAAPTRDDPVTATTWGNTRTRRNFHRQGGGVIQFVSDPRTFVDAALTIREVDDPVLPESHAWVEVRADQVDAGEDGDTRWETWQLRPTEAAVTDPVVPRINRGFGLAARRPGVRHRRPPRPPPAVRGRRRSVRRPPRTGGVCDARRRDGMARPAR
jgi:hypothetical protein